MKNINSHLNERDNSKEQSGFEDIPKYEQCLDPSHNPPGHIVIPQGKIYRHVCPSCGKVVRIKPIQISW